MNHLSSEMIEHLNEACFSGNLKEVSHILNGLDPDSISYHSPLAVCAVEGHLDIIEYLLKYAKNTDFTFDTNTIDNAFQNGHLDIVQYLLKSPIYQCDKHTVNIKKKNLLEVINNGHLEMLEYALTSKDFSAWTDPGKYETYFKHACKNGKLNVVIFFLTSAILPKKMPLKDAYDGFYEAGINKKIEIVKYLVESQELLEHIDINKSNGHALFGPMISSCEELIYYFIFECDMEYTQGVKTKFGADKEIIKLFEKRELSKKLENNLNQNPVNKKIKI